MSSAVRALKHVAPLSASLLLGLSFVTEPPVAHASALTPTGFVESLYAQGWGADDLTGLKFAPDGRLFVTHRTGAVEVLKGGGVLPQPFITVDAATTGPEDGLVGIAFDPDFATNGYVYLSYTARAPTTHQRVSRFTARGDVADPLSELVLLELETIDTGVHVGGGMSVGPDGKLYVGVGDAQDSSNSQSLATGYGKILRINRDGSIPTDNPFYNTAKGQNRAIWALGLRNPFTLTFDPLTGQMFINDVGEVALEEINAGMAGANYGWPATEGYTLDARFTGPIHAYRHGPGYPDGCAIVAGSFYRPTTPTFPSQYVGQYFFMDYCNQWIRVLDPESGSVTGFAQDLGTKNRFTALVGLEIGPDGALYWINRSDGEIYRLQYTGTRAPVIGKEPADVTIQVGSPASFEVRASGDALTYQWQRDGVEILGATASVLTFPTTRPDDSSYRCIVANGLARVASRSALLTATPASASYRGRAPETWTVGETRTYQLEVTNTGAGAWNAGEPNSVRLGVDFDEETDQPNVDWQTDQRFALPTDVPPGGSITVPVTLMPPQVPGNYVLRHRMIMEPDIWFDQVQSTPATVRYEFRLPVLLVLGGATSLTLLGVAWLAYLTARGRVRSLRRLIDAFLPPTGATEGFAQDRPVGHGFPSSAERRRTRRSRT